MKKIIAIAILMICFSAFTNAQEFKATEGNIALELNFTPLSNTPIGLNYLKARYFVADDLVFRLGLDIRMHSNKTEPVNGMDPDVLDEEKMSYSQFGLMPGIEKHFGQWERFSPYVGAEIGFTTKSSKYEYTDNDANVTGEIKNAWSDDSNRGFTTFGINVIAGADFYFTKKFYLGTELGFGFAATSLKEVETTIGSTTTTTDQKESMSDLGFNFNPAIRLGFCF